MLSLNKEEQTYKFKPSLGNLVSSRLKWKLKED